MRIALLADIHGNMAALDAVLADIGKEPIDRFICLGDVASGGPQPAQVLAKLSELGAGIVMGNTEHRLTNPINPDGLDDHVRKLVEIEVWIRATVPASILAPLAAAPMTLAVDLDNGQRLLCCHGSPRSLIERLLAGTPDGDLEPALAGQTFDLLAAGHTHLSMLRHHGRALLLNPGTVGFPIGLGPVASYAILSTDADRVSIEFRRVHYDITPAVEAALESGMPHGEWWVTNWQQVKP